MEALKDGCGGGIVERGWSHKRKRMSRVSFGGVGNWGLCVLFTSNQ